ncbi:MAG: SDR family oxidoreductase [Acidobacteria bacterium]|nr:SDR family oxidoreductase [Acidobacteriota bacterium]
MPLKSKCALVTGGARRIGREIGLSLARSGADVAFTYSKSQEEADQTVEEIGKLGVRSFSVRCDIREPAAVRSLSQEVVSHFGRLDLLVNNAGAYVTQSFEEISPGAWDDMFAVNVRGAFLMTQACAPELRRRKGRVVNIGSLGGIRPWATHIQYCASKAALHMLTQACAKALAPEVTVNCVAPGMIDQGEGGTNPEFMERMARNTPMQRNGSAADVAQAVLFFATCPDFITGEILTVDGGLSLA